MFKRTHVRVRERGLYEGWGKFYWHCMVLILAQKGLDQPLQPAVHARRPDSRPVRVMEGPLVVCDLWPVLD